MSDTDETSAVSNPTELFSTLENRIVQLRSKLEEQRGDSSGAKFELIDRNDLKSKLRDQFAALFGKHFGLLKKCLQTKPSQAAGTSVLTQETCVRLLTLGVQHSYEYAKQVAVEFGYFSERKNWLERFLLNARSDLREMCIELLMSYLKYTNVKNQGEPIVNSNHISLGRESVILRGKWAR